MYERLIWIGMSMGCVMLVFMAITVSADVVLRNLTQASLPWVVEVSEYMLFLSTFLAAPWVLRMGGHVRVDLVVRSLPRRAALVTQSFAELIGLVVCLFLLYYGARTAAEALRLGSLIFKQLVIPEWWLLSFIPITGLLLTVEFCFRFHDLIRGERGSLRENLPEGGAA